MRLYVDGDKIITPNTVFTLYFTLMFCLYTNTYVQLIAQIMLIAYVLMPLLKRGYVRKSEISNLPFYIGWLPLLQANIMAKTTDKSFEICVLVNSMIKM